MSRQILSAFGHKMKIINPYRFATAGTLPTDFANLVLWLDGDDIDTLWQDSAKTTAVTANDDLIGAWEDKSGAGNDALQATSTSRPLYKTGAINGLPAVYGAGVDEFLRATFTVTQPYSVYIVAHAIAELSNDQLIGGATANAGAIYRNATTTLALYSGSIMPGPTVLNTETVLISATFDGASSSIQKNQDTAATGNAGTTAPGGATVLNSNSGVSSCMNANVGEVCMYSTPLSSTDETALQDYLISKWGIT